MTDIENALREFHVAFGAIINEEPTLPALETKTLRLRLLKEEYDELVEAIENDDLPAILQETVDLVYVAVGVTTSYGLPFNAGFDEVHRANMNKLTTCSDCCGGINLTQTCQVCSGTGKIVRQSPQGKILKPEDWQPPDIVSLLL